MRIKRVSMLDPVSGDLVPLATFSMNAGSLIATYHSDRYRRDVVDGGIGLLVEGVFTVLTPSDGQPFFDTLETAYSQSSFMRVERGS